MKKNYLTLKFDLCSIYGQGHLGYNQSTIHCQLTPFNTDMGRNSHKNVCDTQIKFKLKETGKTKYPHQQK